ncbi:exocyst complex component EXO70H1-like [Salvia miltiorrhiza]|uniref:exocyst complex component EXO70H1-like n=1 Tax=Salvia miltiorrhiza TaxID=226208 RepID=UPI0025AD0BE9|nr:exocyst complex component EXO70H1-like [Salvia miltiorrhiza]
MKGSIFSKRSSPSHHSSASDSPSSTPSSRASHQTFSETMMEENLDLAEVIIMACSIDSHRHEEFSSLFVDDRREARRFLDAVSGLQQAMHYYVKLSSSSDKLVRAQNLMQIAIKRLEKEFYVILSANRKNLDSESVSSRSSRASARSSVSDYYHEDEISDEGEESTSTTPPRTPPRGENTEADLAMADLRNIADCMIASGYARECITIYKLIRKSIIDEALYYLGVEKLSQHQMQKMDWNVLEQKIKVWLHAVKIAVKTLFCGERILCDIVFSSSEKIAESCFTEISKDAALRLFSFPEVFGRSKKILSPEKMFRALDLFEAISDLWPEIESIFSHESVAAVRIEAEAALIKLGEGVRIILTQFEAAIQKDSSKTPAGGGVHPLTRYVMNYLVFLADYSGAVSVIMADWSVAAETPLPQAYFSSPTSALADDPCVAAITTRLAWLILVLLCKLDGKAVMYNDVALSYLFLANNLNYVVSKVRNSKLGLLMGPEWISENRLKVSKYLGNYERMGWSKVISSLPEDPMAEISPEQVTDRFERFNAAFEEAYKKQTSWVIPDPKLRDNVKISLAKRVVPAYRIFYNKHRDNYARRFRFGVETIVKYAPEDLNNYLSDLFFAASAGGASTTTTTYDNDTSMSSSCGR